MSERRYCKTCRKECLHDKSSEFSELNDPISRTIIGICTFGITEIAKSASKIWVCQECNEVTKR